MTLVLQRCTSCELVYRRDWSVAFDADSYDYYTRRLNWPVERLYKPINARRIAQLLDDFERRVRGRTLLDVGCGAGQIVHIAARRGWNALGLDLSKPAIAIADRLGANCRNQDFFDHGLDALRFDVVVMSELIEHVPNPARFLRRASELLVPRGILYLTTPNFDSLSLRLLGTSWDVISAQHLSYFTNRTLRQQVEEAGFRVELLESRNLSPAVISRLTTVLRQRPDSARAVRHEGPIKSAATEPTVREQLESSLGLRLVKRLANAALDATRTGESLVAVLRKPYVGRA